MNQKKVAFGILGFIAVAALYFFIAQFIQSNKIIQLQQKLNVQLTEIGANGFTLSDRKIGKEKEHFLICLDDPEKASLFLTQKGIRVTAEELEELRGLMLAVDLSYHNNTIAVDLYPVMLPTFMQAILAQENDKQLLAQFEEMFKKKTLFVHIDIDHSGSAFKGFLKDINETLSGEKKMKLMLQGFHFSGQIKKQKMIKFTQTFKMLHLYIEGLLERTIYDMHHQHILTGPTLYDHTQEYRIGKIKINEAPQAVFDANDLYFRSSSGIKNGLAEETLKTEIKNIDLMFNQETLGIKNFFLDMNTSNLDIRRFETLHKTDSYNEKAFNAPTEKLLPNKIQVSIPMLSVGKIRLHGKEIDGFSLHADITIDSSLDMSPFSSTPEHILSNMDATMELSLSEDLLDLIKEEPKAMLLYMTYRPKIVLDKRIYTIRLKNGLMKINGKELKINGETVRF